jgi:hypothetical protein
MDKQQDTVAHVEAEPQKATSLHETPIHRQVGDAKLAADDEHKTTVRQALRRYPWGVIWTLVVLMSIIMEGASCSRLHLCGPWRTSDSSLV